jgi:hypothetical protein
LKIIQDINRGKAYHKSRNTTNTTTRRSLMSEFTVTDLAVDKLKEYLAQNNIDSALRVALMQGG